jgi:hypothetical protein
MNCLTSDFVHRRNIRITLADPQPSVSSDAFLLTTYGSHHTSLVEYSNGLQNMVAPRFRHDILPVLGEVQSEEQFGAVKSESVTSGNIVKEEVAEVAERDALEAFYGDVDLDFTEQLQFESDSVLVRPTSGPGSVALPSNSSNSDGECDSYITLIVN